MCAASCTEPGSNSPFDCGGLRSADHAARERLADGGGEEVRRDVVFCAVGERSRRRSDRDGADPRPVALRYVGVVQHDTVWNLKSAPPPLCRDRQVRSRRQYVGELVEHERGLVREDPCSVGPEPERDQVLLLTRREMLEPVHSPPDANDLAAVEVLHQQLRRVSRVESLLRREVALLRKRSLVEAVPVRSRLSTRAHARILTCGLVCCKSTYVNLRFGSVQDRIACILI